MATTKTKSTKNTATKSTNTAPKRKMSKRDIRLTLGFFLLLLGSFLTLSIISYFFTWQKDQDSLINDSGIFNFVFNERSIVYNWGGRLGAAMGHLFVYRGLGVVSLIFTIWIAVLGLNLIYGKILISTQKWPRWMAVGFLFLCPLLSFLFAKSSFTYGGALGNELIKWTNGFAGVAGSVLMLLAVFLFFVFVVFQFDIKPIFNSAKSLIPNKKDNEEEDNLTEDETFKGYRNFTEKEEAERNAFRLANEEDHEENEIISKGNTLKKGGVESSLIIEQKKLPELEMKVINKTFDEESEEITQLQETKKTTKGIPEVRRATQ